MDKIYSEDKRSFIEEKKLFPKSVNPYNYILFKNKPDNKFFKNYDIYKNNYLNIIMKQFTFNGEYLDVILFLEFLFFKLPKLLLDEKLGFV